MSGRPIRVIVSGGIGAGKSAVGRLLARRGALVIDADRLAHEVLEGEAFEQVATRWPETVSGPGRVDRRALGRVVFSDPAELRALEAITHPHVFARLAGMVEGAQAPMVVVEAPVPAELPGEGWVRVVVDAPDHLRLGRSVERGMEETDVRRRMALQPSREEWRDLGHHVLDNSSDLGELEEQVALLWEELTKGRAPGGR